MNFVFKIFGAPYTFDIYGSNQEDTNYFQLYDDGSNEEVKLTVHRKANGEVCYSYLRYNMISSSGRTGAFFGMAVVFHNEYCRDVENLYKLFDAVYQNILETGILLQKIENSAHQAKYLIAHFSDAPTEVTRIENIIYNNLQKNYSQDILPINSSFSTNSKELIMLPMNKEANVSLLTELRKRAWISFSPIYNSQVILSREYINTLKTNTRIIRDKELSEITNLLVRINLLSEDKKKEKLPKDILLQITNWRDSLKETQKTINDYINIQPEPGRSQLEKINNEIIPILESCETNYTVVKNIIDKPKSEPSKQPRPEPPKPEPPKPEPPKPNNKKTYLVITHCGDDGGAATGGGYYSVDSLVKVVAIPNPGYRFISWTEKGKILSENKDFSFPMYNRTIELVAHFEAKQTTAWDIFWERLPKKAILAIGAVVALILLLIFLFPSEDTSKEEGKKGDTLAQITPKETPSPNLPQLLSEENGSELIGDCDLTELNNYGNIKNIDNLDTIKAYINEAEKLKNKNCPNIEKLYITPAKERAEKILENELKNLYDTKGKKWKEKYKMVEDKITKYKLLFSNLSFDDYEKYYKKETIKNLELELENTKWSPRKKLEIANDLLSIDPDNKKAKEEISKLQGTQGSGIQGSETKGSGTKGSGTKGSGTKGSGNQGSGNQGNGNQGNGNQGNGNQGNGVQLNDGVNDEKKEGKK